MHHIAAALARKLFDDKVAVDDGGLARRQQRRVLIEVSPTRLNPPDALVGEEVGHRALEKIGRRHKVCIEDGGIVALGHSQTFAQRARFVAGPRRPVQVDNIHPRGPPARNRLRDDFERRVGGVVENLNLQPLARPVQVARGLDRALDDETFVVDRDLHGDQRGFTQRRYLEAIIAVPPG
ncbi:MAG TPA: hypothetical protein VJG32_17405 [Anaerolineae bacterium]|nr:hypothetical protein [Anaerolineae bacterium]